MNFQKFCAEILPHITCGGEPIDDFEDFPDNLEFFDDEVNIWRETEYQLSELNIKGLKFRIKPKVEYRPFTKEDEEIFFGMKVYNNKSKQPCLIVACWDNGVWITKGVGNDSVSYQTLLELFVFPNGIPCGVML